MADLIALITTPDNIAIGVLLVVAFWQQVQIRAKDKALFDAMKEGTAALTKLTTLIEGMTYGRRVD